MAHSRNSNRQSDGRRNAAKIAARKILAAYPNYKPNEDYVLLIISTLELFPVAVIERVADLRVGIAARSPQFMPTQGELVQFCNEYEDTWRKLQQPSARERIAAKPEEDNFGKPDDPEYRHKVIANALSGGEPLDPVAREKFRKCKTEREPYRPFPKLWEAFADDPDMLAILNSGLPFDKLFSLSRTLATRGKDETRVTP